MGERNDKVPGDFLLDLITSEMNLARAFTAVSRSAYQLRKMEEGNFARLKAIQLYSEAARLAPQLADGPSEELECELQALSTSINWLFMQPLASAHSFSAENQHTAIENPPIAFEEN